MDCVIKLLVLLAGSVHLTIGASLSEELLQYTISMVQHYARQKPGRFECVFYDVSAGSDYGWLTELLASPQLNNVTKYVIDDKLRVDYGIFPPKPTLTVIYVGEHALHPTNPLPFVRLFFGLLDTNAPIMVLVNTENFHAYQGIGAILAIGQFDKVTFIGTKQRRIIQMGVFGMALSVTARFPHPQDLIRSNIPNSQGRYIGFTNIIQPWYPAQVWALHTALYLNISLRYFPGVCSIAMPQSDCVERLFKAAHIDIALDHRDASGYTSAHYRMLFAVIPISRVVLVPQGRPFNTVEMFTKPFAWEAWIVVLLTLTLIEVITLIFPALFKNDPILLLVCGFERYNLHQASAREKATMLPLMVFFFLMFNAYETKIISFMMNKPSIGNIKTLDELSKSDLKITADLEIDNRLMNDSILGPLMVHKPNNVDNSLLDGEHAQLSTNLEASWMVSLMRNYDFKLHRPKYVVINERKSTSIVTYWIGMKTPLAEAFYYTQKVFFESGLLFWWQDELMHDVAVRDQMVYRLATVDQSGLLSFDDLSSTWLVYGIGVLVSLVVLLLEFLLLFFHRYKENKNVRTCWATKN